MKALALSILYTVRATFVYENFKDVIFLFMLLSLMPKTPHMCDIVVDIVQITLKSQTCF